MSAAVELVVGEEGDVQAAAVADTAEDAVVLLRDVFDYGNVDDVAEDVSENANVPFEWMLIDYFGWTIK